MRSAELENEWYRDVIPSYSRRTTIPQLKGDLGQPEGVSSVLKMIISVVCLERTFYQFGVDTGLSNSASLLTDWS